MQRADADATVAAAASSLVCEHAADAARLVVDLALVASALSRRALLRRPACDNGGKASTLHYEPRFGQIANVKQSTHEAYERPQQTTFAKYEGQLLFTYGKIRRGPVTLPGGIPEVTSPQDENCCSTLIFYFLARSLSIHLGYQFLNAVIFKPIQTMERPYCP
ncbi:Protein of unknown function [Gryllus bimaculatus]|nr:Protein of unknown function [Gryllus bimaculatus]